MGHIDRAQAPVRDEGKHLSGGGPGEARNPVGDGPNGPRLACDAKLALAVVVPVPREEGQRGARRIVGAGAAQVGNRGPDLRCVTRGDLGDVEVAEQQIFGKARIGRMGDGRQEGDQLTTGRDRHVARDAARELAARRAFRAGENAPDQERRQPAVSGYRL